MKVTFLIPYSAKESHKNNAVAQSATCFRDLPPGVTIHYIVAEEAELPAELASRALRVPLADGYFQVLAKTVFAVRQVLAYEKPDFIIRGNSSNFFQINEISRFLSRLEPDSDFYGGKRTVVTDEMTPLERPVVYAGGSGIYLSNATAKKLVYLDPADYYGVVDDVAIGHFFEERGVTLSPLERNDVTDFEPLRTSLQTRVKSWESNERTVIRFHSVHKILSENSRGKKKLASTSFFLSELWFLLSKKRIEAALRLVLRFRPLNPLPRGASE